MNDPSRVPAILSAFELQIDWCEKLGSPFTASVLRIVKAEIAAGGDATEIALSVEGDPVASGLALRMAGGLHYLALSGREPELVPFYENGAALGMAEPERLAAAIDRALRRREADMVSFVRAAVQTNEATRSAALLGGFLQIAQECAAPLALYEIGASAGLNLLWDSYFYRLGEERVWGDPASPVILESQWSGEAPALGQRVRVVSRAGCDTDPIDVRNEEAVLRASAYFWPDQPERLERFRRACAMTADAGVELAALGAGDWLATVLPERPHDAAAVVFHSIMWQYMPPEEQERVRSLIEAAGSQAGSSAPLFWLRLEPDEDKSVFDLKLTSWSAKGGKEQTRRLAWSHPHGKLVRWLQDGE